MSEPGRKPGCLVPECVPDNSTSQMLFREADQRPNIISIIVTQRILKKLHLQLIEATGRGKCPWSHRLTVMRLLTVKERQLGYGDDSLSSLWTRLCTGQHVTARQMLTLLQHTSRVKPRASLVARWKRIRLPLQETRVPSLIREEPTCCGATACEPRLLSLRSRPWEPQLLKPKRLERSHRNEKPARSN
ncbi:hypothetical protein MJG53_004030 [Ovis ammon polii x Ovis aries]|uniref:Uncharacterized protein n=2 Tax=Ovis TaxID=9935 RepID=A0AAD4UJV5_OVIAM|nr:hypothetical protein MG293_002532 [Ovis ammon polii]KAI4576230.1 hypothetical protein MJT46_002065 [Ovis ammon polii x Ovis aries]KAI4586243.1 hypothetical protein MJG53_004030 [Ovis ammon polii x Ovis aries]